MEKAVKKKGKKKKSQACELVGRGERGDEQREGGRGAVPEGEGGGEFIGARPPRKREDRAKSL